MFIMSIAIKLNLKYFNADTINSIIANNIMSIVYYVIINQPGFIKFKVTFINNLNWTICSIITEATQFHFDMYFSLNLVRYYSQILLSCPKSLPGNQVFI